jgi:large subunit ribosomal protein L4
MGQVNVIKMDRSKAEPLELEDGLTEATYNPFLIKDAVVYQRAKLRQGTHATKSRGQVSGSTRKLYRQKGTGSARAGDRKAVQRRGGGVVHGPVPRSHAIKLNKRVRKAALRGALAEKLRQGQIVVLDAIEPASHKTKDFAAWLAHIEAPEALIVTHEVGENLALAARNLPQVVVVHFGQVNVYNLLLYDKVLVTRQAMLALQERLAA